MLGISGAELLVIILVGLCFLKPKDLMFVLGIIYRGIRMIQDKLQQTHQQWERWAQDTLVSTATPEKKRSHHTPHPSQDSQMGLSFEELLTQNNFVSTRPKPRRKATAHHHQKRSLKPKGMPS